MEYGLTTSSVKFDDYNTYECKTLTLLKFNTQLKLMCTIVQKVFDEKQF